MLRLVEYAELEALSVTNPAWLSGTRFTPAACKQARYAGTPADLGLIRQRANNDLQSARKVVTLLPRWADAGDEHNAALKEWLASAGDFGDAALVANAKYVQVPHVLADDIDLLTFDGITVYTANQARSRPSVPRGSYCNAARAPAKSEAFQQGQNRGLDVPRQLFAAIPGRIGRLWLARPSG